MKGVRFRTNGHLHPLKPCSIDVRPSDRSLQRRISRRKFQMRSPSLAAVALGAFLAFAAASSIFAQQQFTDAPIPAQILSAKRIFISNASGESVLPPGTGDLAYNEFYAAMKTWGHYEIVASPADADLVFEIRTMILDPKTHVVLWAFSESVAQAANKIKSRQLFDQAMFTLLNDLKQL